MLSDLISEYLRLETALHQSMIADVPVDRRAHLLRACADMLDRIEGYDAREPGEIKDQIFFFLRRGVEHADTDIGGRAVDIALLLGRREIPDRPAAPRPRSRDPAGSLVRLVTASPDRVSMIGSDFRYIATSDANARHYGTRPARLVGTPVEDVIGTSRFRYRAKRRLEECFAGRPQDYYHLVEGPEADDAPRLMRCRMTPVADDLLGQVALVHMDDATAQVSIARDVREPPRAT